jgi:hypothetical protein
VSTNVYADVSHIEVQQSQAIEKMNESEQYAVEDSTGYSWIAGKMLGIKHIKLIEAGGSGEVHKVSHCRIDMLTEVHR